jgi:cytolysin-activating lysine-acyltransferase
MPESANSEMKASAHTGVDGGKPARQAVPTPAEVLCEIAVLMMQSPAHRHFFLADLEWLVVPAVLTRQFVIYRKQRAPVAYASWALVNEEVEKRLIAGERRLAPAEWRSGDRTWLIDLVAPFGGTERIVADLRARVLTGREVKTLRPGPGGGAPVVETWQAIAAKPTATAGSPTSAVKGIQPSSDAVAVEA